MCRSFVIATISLSNITSAVLGSLAAVAPEQVFSQFSQPLVFGSRESEF
jgi:hypothetical protein